MLVLVGSPLFFFEMVLGQYSGISCTKLFSRLSPGLRGLGYGMLSIPVVVGFQYVMVMAYGFYFMFSGFQSTLPWTYCDSDYNTVYCYSLKQAGDDCNLTVQTLFNGTCEDSVEFCDRFEMGFEPAQPQTCENTTGIYVPQQELHPRRSPSEEFWYYNVLKIDVGPDGILNTDVNSWTKWGSVRWEIVGCLALSWTVICLSLIKGTASYGKVVYVTTTFPYVVLTILMAYVATLDGFVYGMEFYFIPEDWSKLADINVWNAAASQIFFSLGLGVGTQLAVSSYNRFDSNSHRDAILIAICNSLTSLYAGAVVFGALGYVATQKGVGIEGVIDSGPGLAFIVFPEAVSTMVVSPLFSFLFFLMLLLLAVSTVCALVESLIAAVTDEVTFLRNHRVKVVVSACFIGFLGGLSMCFESGYLMFSLIDARVSNAMLVLALIELVVVSWFYGSDKLLKHVAEMGMKLPTVLQWHWYLTWTFFTPAILFVVIGLAWAGFEGDSTLGYTFPGWASAMGWGIELMPVAIIAAVVIYTTVKRFRAGKEIAFLRVGPQMVPNSQWGPRPDRPNAVKAKDNAGYVEE
jgi:solute carrier family 6 amino acid transporter-like protein 5/7/9/14